jgi:hypothetical protein
MSSYIDQIFCGGHQSKPAIKLRAGNLSMIYEHGNIRYISAGRNEIIRMIYSAVRDKNWLTIDPVITDERIERSANSFRIIYNCYYKSGDLNFSAHYSITGLPDNTIVLSLEGEALSTFEKNRIGFCVLHPVRGCSGNSCIITHSDGSSKEYKFPSDISPDQAFLDIKAMRWETEGSECSIEFSGDVFETEDQRNWSDASFKTYCTPLYKPFPVTVAKGEKISQLIVFKAVSKSVYPENVEDNVKVTFSNDALIPLPMIGIGRSTRQIPLTEN